MAGFATSRAAAAHFGIISGEMAAEKVPKCELCSKSTTAR